MLKRHRRQQHLHAALAARPPGPHLLLKSLRCLVDGRRLLLITPGYNGQVPLKPGDRIELRTPDGQMIPTKLVSLMHVNWGVLPPEQRGSPIVVEAVEDITEVLPGTEAWLVLD